MAKHILFLLYLLTLLTSCNQKEYIRVDSNLVYQNILDTIIIQIDSLGSKGVINESIYSALDFVNLKSKVEIYGIVKEILLNNDLNLTYKKLNKGNSFINNNSIDESALYFCGKINLNKNVESLLFLIHIKMESFIGDLHLGNSNKLLLCNLKSNRLCSVVKISEKNEIQNEHTNGLESTIINNTLLSYESIKTFDNKRYCLYTTYFIDDNGFIRFQWFPFNEVSGYFK